jgi:hypothetical protein
MKPRADIDSLGDVVEFCAHESRRKQLQSRFLSVRYLSRNPLTINFSIPLLIILVANLINDQASLYPFRHVHIFRSSTIMKGIYPYNAIPQTRSLQPISSNTPDRQAGLAVLPAVIPSQKAAARAFQKAVVRERQRRADQGSPAWGFGAVSKMRDRWLMLRTVRALPAQASVRGIDAGPGEEWCHHMDTAEGNRDHVLAVCWCMAVAEAVS